MKGYVTILKLFVLHCHLYAGQSWSDNGTIDEKIVVGEALRSSSSDSDFVSDTRKPKR